MLDRGRVWRPPAAQTDTRWRRSFGDAAGRWCRATSAAASRAAARRRQRLLPLDEEHARASSRCSRRCGVEGVAICLLNAYVNPVHERRLRELVREVLGDVAVSISSETSPLAKEYARASTTVIDVIMKLIFTGYAHALDGGLRDAGFAGELNFADCAATLLPWAGGAGAAVPDRLRRACRRDDGRPRLGEALGERNLVCCDVGGTSTDVSLVVDGRRSSTTPSSWSTT